VTRQKVRKDAKLEISGLEYVAGVGRGNDGSAAGGGGGGGDDDDDSEGGGRAASAAEATPEEHARIAAARAQIRAGLGATLGSAEDRAGSALLFVPGASAAAAAPEEDAPSSFDPATGLGLTQMPPRHDARAYGSDEEDYDSEDQATTLALGTLMLRKSRAKKLVDASYNRYQYMYIYIYARHFICLLIKRALKQTCGDKTTTTTTTTTPNNNIR
jgi:hypothetical protein